MEGQDEMRSFADPLLEMVPVMTQRQCGRLPIEYKRKRDAASGAGSKGNQSHLSTDSREPRTVSPTSRITKLIRQ